MLRIFIFSLMFLPISAHAEWRLLSEESAFSEGGRHVAYVETPDYEYSLSVLCDVSRLFLAHRTYDKAIPDQIRTLNTGNPQLLLRVDGGDVKRLSGVLADFDGNTAIFSNISKEEFGQISNTESQIAVALAFGSEIYHEATYIALPPKTVLQDLKQRCAYFKN